MFYIIPCQYIFASVPEVYSLHLSKILFHNIHSLTSLSIEKHLPFKKFFNKPKTS